MALYSSSFRCQDVRWSWAWDCKVSEQAGKVLGSWAWDVNFSEQEGMVQGSLGCEQEEFLKWEPGLQDASPDTKTPANAGTPQSVTLHRNPPGPL